MKRISIVHILVLLACFFGARAQDTSKLDSLRSLLHDANQIDSAKYIMFIGEEYFDFENYSLALEDFFTSLKIYEAIDDLNGIADASNSIGRVYYNMENFQEGLVYFSKALNYYEKIGDETSTGGVLNNLALIYYEIDSIDSAIEYYQKALVIKEKYDDKLSVAAIYHNLGLVYMNQKKFANAIENLVSSRKIFLELGHGRHAANTTNNIGRAYYKNAQYNEALEYFIKGLEEAKKLNSSFLIMDNYKYQADCYAKMGHYESAYYYSNEYYVHKDSLLNIDKNKEIAEIQAKYENEIKEQENELLRKDNETKESTIRMQYIFSVGILIIFILVAILAIIY
jgi:tetratricopeptide (TPR) repeat protein